MLSLIRIRVKYVLRHPLLLFWTYLFIPLLILLFVLYKFIRGKINFNLLNTEKSYSIDKQYIFFKDAKYPNLNRYWDYTIFVADKNEDCQKIHNFFNYTFKNPNMINCTVIENNYTNKSENIIKIEKKSDKYRVI